jgi:hypothetical protein
VQRRVNEEMGEVKVVAAVVMRTLSEKTKANP